MVIGPGTGLGTGILIKGPNEGDPYEPYPAEGGHSDFSIKSEEDWELFKFAQNYIATSKNIENQRGKGKVDRISIERLCAGPAVPLIYAFMKTKYPDLETVIEKKKHFNDVIS